jgi:hypothetical protein
MFVMFFIVSIGVIRLPVLYINHIRLISVVPPVMKPSSVQYRRLQCISHIILSNECRKNDDAFQ